jgi:hypothetical protein
MQASRMGGSLAARVREEQRMRVVQLSDIHISGTRAVQGSWGPHCGPGFLVAQLAALQPDCIVVTGDLSANDPDEIMDAHAAQRWLEGLAAELGVQLLVIPGNHDVGENEYHPDVAEAWRGRPVSSRRVQSFAHRWGSDHFVADWGDVLSIGINSQLLGSGTGEERDQNIWLTECLTGLNRPWVLWSHQPFELPDGSSPGSHWALPPLAARGSPWHSEGIRAPAAIFSGHLHAYAAHSAGPTVHVSCPSAAYTIPADALAPLACSFAVTGFLVHEFSAAGMTHRLVECERT